MGNISSQNYDFEGLEKDVNKARIQPLLKENFLLAVKMQVIVYMVSDVNCMSVHRITTPALRDS